ncbi:MAG: cbb3-type cytochrome c oxidase subunit I [Thermodesulfovibrionales bacterium]|nr:cbb3-type cytochrome c oxidase subunit I [Thermodesulfovibrionales bacterium]
MDRFVKSFILMSIVYLAIATVLGIFMLGYPSLMQFKFVHSHLMMLGWVSMMIYGVGYHILPKFSGRLLKSPKLGELQFWLANIGLMGMLAFYTLGTYNPSGLYRGLVIASGLIEALSISLFFYNIIATLYAKVAE